MAMLNNQRVNHLKSWYLPMLTVSNTTGFNRRAWPLLHRVLLAHALDDLGHNVQVLGEREASALNHRKPGEFWSIVIISNPQIDGKVNHHQITRDICFHLIWGWPYCLGDLIKKKSRKGVENSWVLPSNMGVEHGGTILQRGLYSACILHTYYYLWDKWIGPTLNQGFDWEGLVTRRKDYKGCGIPQKLPCSR